MSLIVRDMVVTDVARIVELGAEYVEEAPTKELTFSPTTTDHNYRVVILDKVRYFCQVAVEDESGEYVGILLAKKVQPFFSDVYMSQDVMFYVRKQYRTRYPQASIMLLRNYRQWAAVQQLVMANITTISGIQSDRTAEFFDRLGFTKRGTIHSLELGYGCDTEH